MSKLGRRKSTPRLTVRQQFKITAHEERALCAIAKKRECSQTAVIGWLARSTTNTEPLLEYIERETSTMLRSNGSPYPSRNAGVRKHIELSPEDDRALRRLARSTDLSLCQIVGALIMTGPELRV